MPSLPRTHTALAALLVLSCVTACGGTDPGNVLDGAIPCSDDSECPVGQLCAGGFCTTPGDGGAAIDASRPADIVVTPTTLDFGSPLLDADTTLPLEISNLGGTPLQVTRIEIFEGDDAPEYSATPIGEVMLTIAPGETIMVAVTLHAIDAEDDIATLHIASDDADEPQVVVNLVSELKGMPDLGFAPPAIDFGIVAFLATADRDVDLVNQGNGNAPLVISSIAVTNTTGLGDLFSTSIFLVAPDGTETAATPPLLLSAAEPLLGRLADVARIRVRFRAATLTSGPIPVEHVVVLSDDGDTPRVEIPMTGAVLGCAAPAPEVCDGLDNDCDLEVDEDDPDGGGHCDSSHPGLCTPGVLHCLAGVLTCVPDITPGSVAETCNAVDEDCDGTIDDSVMQMCSTACGVGVEFCFVGTFFGCTAPPALPETCNAIDDDCDLATDEDNPGGGGACGTGLPGVCGAGTVQCLGGALSCVATILSGTMAEICDGLDNDCNGVTDETPPESTCPTQHPGATSVTAWACTSGACVAAVCTDGLFDADVSPGNGCECGSGLHPPVCAAAGDVALGTGTSATMTGVVETATGSDYASFSFAAGGAGSLFHPRVTLSDSGGGQYAMDVVRDCGTDISCDDKPDATGVDLWESNFVYTDGPGCCSDAIARPVAVKVRVYRRLADAPTCTPYTVTAENL